jgi:hypothetical protein
VLAFGADLRFKPEHIGKRKPLVVTDEILHKARLHTLQNPSKVVSRARQLAAWR